MFFLISPFLSRRSYVFSFIGIDFSSVVLARSLGPITELSVSWVTLGTVSGGLFWVLDSTISVFLDEASVPLILSSFPLYFFSLISSLWSLWRLGTGTSLCPVKAFPYYLGRTTIFLSSQVPLCHLLMSEDPCQNEISFLIRKLILLAKGLSSGKDLCQGLIMLVGSLLVHLHKDYFICYVAVGFPGICGPGRLTSSLMALGVWAFATSGACIRIVAVSEGGCSPGDPSWVSDSFWVAFMKNVQSPRYWRRPLGGLT